MPKSFIIYTYELEQETINLIFDKIMSLNNIKIYRFHDYLAFESKNEILYNFIVDELYLNHRIVYISNESFECDLENIIKEHEYFDDDLYSGITLKDKDGFFKVICEARKKQEYANKIFQKFDVLINISNKN